MITVFTPAYNRAHLLPRLFESLCKQTYRDFEWVIVDDGSVDDTRSVVEQFSVLGFEFSGNLTQPLNTQHSTLKTNLNTQHSTPNTNSIRYFYQENGGKHRAINRGVKEAKGELFFIVDSDDLLAPFALERIEYHYGSVRCDRHFSGVSGMRAFPNNKRIGGELSFDVKDLSPLDYWFKLKIVGDSAEVYRTEIIRKFPFPEIDGEKFCPEALVWYRIAKAGYKLRFFNEKIYICEYLPDGLTAKITKIRVESPIASAMTYWELYYSSVNLKARLRAGISFWRFYYHIKSPYHFEKKPLFLLSPLGWMMYFNDRKKIYGRV